jgi:hypothetical protein
MWETTVGSSGTYLVQLSSKESSVGVAETEQGAKDEKRPYFAANT